MQTKREMFDEVCRLAMLYQSVAELQREEIVRLRDQVEWLHDYLNERDYVLIRQRKDGRPGRFSPRQRTGSPASERQPPGKPPAGS